MYVFDLTWCYNVEKNIEILIDGRRGQIFSLPIPCLLLVALFFRHWLLFFLNATTPSLLQTLTSPTFFKPSFPLHCFYSTPSTSLLPPPQPIFFRNLQHSSTPFSLLRHKLHSPVSFLNITSHFFNVSLSSLPSIVSFSFCKNSSLLYNFIPSSLVAVFLSPFPSKKISFPPPFLSLVLASTLSYLFL